MVKLLVSHGAKVNGNWYREPLLSVAIRESTIEIVDYLIASGARMSRFWFFGTTPLDAAIKFKRKDMEDHFNPSQQGRFSLTHNSSIGNLIFEIFAIIFICIFFYYVRKIFFM
ncbi:hypothetical protein TVAG_303560 [Trichomonas vaginalis G3]|uniref:Ankyrin repeat protein n=1 Tax=Trichomonas vaginalis (strain ATCC PRA-98 / G3) TaxID=412133 RepID=A2DR38_TRIV3|nr:Ankyrin repeat family [Trichomonas vaginalis G3]EAY17137.1 hypothetical protein TVAG_303560 [Trichomonas vaginalis G3]KAI5508853.1 Ankyrin repeat family [Trichomonas vaginalis G3]|eukprot:XP_001329360.1 hypothetical protein [Trichomonas vaginalis G3]